jgi:methionyl-tRNA synthetase
MVVDNAVNIPFKNIDIKLENEYKDYIRAFDNYEINKACDVVWNIIQKADKRIQVEQPFKLIKTDKDNGKKIIEELGVESA